MRKLKYVLVFTTLLLLLAGVTSAADVSKDTQGTSEATHQALIDTTQAPQANNNIEESISENIKTDTIQDNKANTNKNMQKDTKNTLKMDSTVNSWDTLASAVSSATSDTTIKLGEGTYTTTNTIEFNQGITVTIDGNGQTIDGNQQQVFNISKVSSLVLKNITIKNAKSSDGGAIYNQGALTITQSTFTDNTATNYGGAIYNIGGHLTITQSTLTNNNATYGGAIRQNSIFFAVVSDCNFTSNTALKGAAIHAGGNVNLTGNVFTENTATSNKETIDLYGYWTGEFDGNIYNSTDISLDKISLRVKDDKNIFKTYDNITLNYTIRPLHSIYYKDFDEGISDITLYINGVKNVTTKYENYTLSNLDPGEYTVYYTTCNSQSNPVTFTVEPLKITNWQELQDAVSYAEGKTEDITLTLEDGTYTNTGTIPWNNPNMVLTIDGNGQTIDGNQQQVFNIKSGSSLVLKNITIKNAKVYGYGGAIDNRGTLTITQSTLTNNTADTGGAIYNDGTLTITQSTLTNNTANFGGAIYNYDGTLNITQSTLTNNTADTGGAIQNRGTLNITQSTLTNNNATYGGAIRHNTNIFAVVANCNFTSNTASNGAAIHAEGYINLTGNIFTENKASNKETIDLYGFENGIFNGNLYNSTDINLEEMSLSVKDNQTTSYDEGVTLNFTIKPSNSNHYKDFEEGISDITLYINGEKNITTKYENTTLTNLKSGEYEVYFTSCNQQSNTATFTVKYDTNITTPLDSYEYYPEINTKIPLTITDPNEEKGTITLYVYETEVEYKSLSIYLNVGDEYILSTETIAQLLENTYGNLDSSYVINVTYSGDYANPSSTEFTLNINKKKNTTITVNPIQSSIGLIANLSANVVDVNNKPVSGGLAVFKVNGITLKDENNNVIYANVNKGKASINYKVQSSWIKNTSYVEAVYGGTESYASSRIKASDVLNISQGTVNISMEKELITAKTDEKVTLRVKVLDSNGDRINNGKIIFKLNGITLKDENGKALSAQVIDGDATLEYTIPPTFSAKTYTLTAVYSEKNYQRRETTSTLILEKKGITINTDNITTTNNKTTIKATITDETGKLLVKNTKIAIKVNGKTVLNNATSNNGKIDVSFNVTFKPGMYELLIISAENGIYKSGKMTTVLKI